MVKLAEKVEKVRSKNAGPFWLTIDLFCGSPENFEFLRDNLRTEQIAGAFDVPTQILKRFDIADLNVIKFSLPRPQVQGSRQDRDMHGASWAALLSELKIA